MISQLCKPITLKVYNTIECIDFTLNSFLSVYLYIKDKSSHKGPIPIQLYSYMSVKQLKLKVNRISFNKAKMMAKTTKHLLNKQLTSYLPNLWSAVLLTLPLFLSSK